MSRTFIDKYLSLRERGMLVDWLLERTTNPTGETILNGMRELFPAFEEYPSIASCLNWKRNGWAFELHKRELKEDSEAASILAEAGDGSNLDEANRVLLQSMIFQQLRAFKEGRLEEVDPELLNKMAKNVATLARQGMAERELRVKLDKLEAEKKQAEAALGSDELSEAEKAAKMRSIFGL